MDKQTEFRKSIINIKFLNVTRMEKKHQSDVMTKRNLAEHKKSDKYIKMRLDSYDFFS